MNENVYVVVYLWAICLRVTENVSATTEVCLDSRERHLAPLWRFSAPDIMSWLTYKYLLTVTADSVTLRQLYKFTERGACVSETGSGQCIHLST